MALHLHPSATFPWIAPTPSCLWPGAVEFLTGFTPNFARGFCPFFVFCCMLIFSKSALTPTPVHHGFSRLFVPMKLAAICFFMAWCAPFACPPPSCSTACLGSWRQAPRGLLLDVGGRRECRTLNNLRRECGTVNSLRRECGTLNSLKLAHSVVGEVLLPAQVPRPDQPAKTAGWWRTGGGTDVCPWFPIGCLGGYVAGTRVYLAPRRIMSWRGVSHPCFGRTLLCISFWFWRW